MKAALFLVAVLAVFATANAQAYCTDDGSYSFKICKNVIAAIVGAGTASMYNIPTCMQGGNNIFNTAGTSSVMGNITATYNSYQVTYGITMDMATVLNSTYANNTAAFAASATKTSGVIMTGYLVSNISAALSMICTSFPGATYMAPTGTVAQTGTVLASAYLSCSAIALDTKYDDSFATACSTAATTSAGVFTCTGAVLSSIKASSCMDGSSIPATSLGASYRAPPGSTVVSPLTTLVQYVARSQGLTPVAAAMAVAKALKICTDSTCVAYASLLGLDPIATLAGDKTQVSGQKAFVYNAVLQNLLEAMNSLGNKFVAASGTRSGGHVLAEKLLQKIAAAAISARRRNLLAAGDLATTLNDPTASTTLVTSATSDPSLTAATGQSLTTLNTYAAQSAALSATVATLVAAAAASGGSVTAIMTQIAQINVAAAAYQANITSMGQTAPNSTVLSAAAAAVTVNTTAIAATASAANTAIALVTANKATVVKAYLKFASASTATVNAACTTATAITIGGSICSLAGVSQIASVVQAKMCGQVAADVMSCYYKSVVSNGDSVASTFGTVISQRRLLAGSAATVSTTGFVSTSDISTASSAAASPPAALTSALSTSTGQSVTLSSTAPTTVSGASAALPSFAALLAAIAALLML